MKKGNTKSSKSVKEKLSDIFELPNDVTLGSSKITITGVNQINIENYSGILEYSSEFIRVKTTEKIVVVEGIALNIGSMTDTDIYINGKVNCVRWE